MSFLSNTRLPEQLFAALSDYIDRYYEPSSPMFRPKPATRRHRQPEWRDFCEEAALPCATASLEDMLRQMDAGFTETLLKLIDRSGEKDSVIYKRAGLSRQHFSKIRNDPHYSPTKPTAVALALALRLDLAQTNDLIGRAGFTLSNSSKFDLIIRYFIEHSNFDITEINMALYEFDQPLLGG